MKAMPPRPRQLVVTINGPGEIAAWLTPFAAALKARAPEMHVAVALLPCVFSSGAELSVLERLETVDAACAVSDSWGMILRGDLPAGFLREAETLVFHFGGELALTRALAWRLGAEIFAYADHEIGPRRAFARVFYSGLTRPRGARGEDFVGELMVDAARLIRSTAPHAQGGSPVIGLYPGSRDYMVRYLLPFLAIAADKLAPRHPDAEFLVAQAPFVSEALLADFPPPVVANGWDGTPLRLESEQGGRFMVTEAGTRLRLTTNAEVLARADLAISLPGTNSGEMAAAGVPMVTILPTHFADLAPLPGLAGHIGRLPLVGRPLKRFFAHQALKSYDFLAQPNRRAGRRLVPELVGLITPAEIVAAVEQMLAGDLKALGREVQAAMGPPGAAEKLAEEVTLYFDSRRG
ncbi:MAG: hypothetical protein D6811_05040 [Alphaproteobacteria bacterium]|nr:MAG: hypothetical protein D6811_05040 [Alphaproteobacteria bacterium]